MRSFVQSLRDAINKELTYALPVSLSSSALLQRLSLVPPCCTSGSLSPIYRCSLGYTKANQQQLLSFLFHRGLGRDCCCCIPAAGDTEAPLAVLSLHQQTSGWSDWRHAVWLPEIKDDLYLLRCIAVSPLTQTQYNNSGSSTSSKNRDEATPTDSELVDRLKCILNAAVSHHQEEARCLLPQLRPRLDVSVSPISGVYTAQATGAPSKKLFIVLDVSYEQQQHGSNTAAAATRKQ